jgi:GTPase SAR1 family protein
VVFDLTNYTSFQNIKQWIEELHYQGKPHLLILLLGNKLDVVLKSNMAR